MKYKINKIHYYKRSFNKKGLVVYFDLIFIILALVLLVVVSMWVFRSLNDSRKARIDEAVNTFNDEFFIIGYLKTPTADGKTIGELISAAYDDGDYSKVRDETKKVLEKAFNAPACFELMVEEQSVIKDKNKCLDKVDEFESTAAIPSSYSNSVKKITVKLKIW